MKKIIVLILVCIMLMALLCGCNKSVFDTTYKFDRAIISLPNGEIVEGKVKSWKDFEGDQLQVTIGKNTYLVHSADIVMIAEK